MKITNKTTKIIGIGGVAILPNESADIPAGNEIPSIVKHLASTGKISIGGDAAPEGDLAGKSPAGRGKGDRKKVQPPMSEAGPKDEAGEAPVEGNPDAAAG